VIYFHGEGNAFEEFFWWRDSMMLLCVTALKAAGGATSSMHGVILAMWQAQDAIDSGHAVWLEVFVGLVALALLVQAAVMVGILVAGLKAQKVIMGHVLEIKGKVMPLVEKSHALMTDLTPEIKQITTKVHDITQKVDVITAHVEAIAGLAKDKAVEFSPTISKANVTFGEATDTARDVNQKTRAQVSRVNGMVSSTLDATAALGKAIQHGISVPGREIAGLVSGAKAMLESMRGSARGFGSSARPGRSTYTSYSRPQTAGSGFPVSSGIPIGEAGGATKMSAESSLASRSVPGFRWIS
jgi:hypothetical protein